MQITEKILKLALIHTSVIYQISYICCIHCKFSTPFRKNSNFGFTFLYHFRILYGYRCTVKMECIIGNDQLGVGYGRAVRFLLEVILVELWSTSMFVFIFPSSFFSAILSLSFPYAHLSIIHLSQCEWTQIFPTRPPVNHPSFSMWLDASLSHTPTCQSLIWFIGNVTELPSVLIRWTSSE